MKDIKQASLDAMGKERKDKPRVPISISCVEAIGTKARPGVSITFPRRGVVLGSYEAMELEESLRSVRLHKTCRQEVRF